MDNHSSSDVLLYAFSPHQLTQSVYVSTLTYFMSKHLVQGHFAGFCVRCSQQVCCFETTDFEITASFHNLHKHFPSGVLLYVCSPSASKSRFSVCFAFFINTEGLTSVLVSQPCSALQSFHHSSLSVVLLTHFFLLSFPFSDGDRLQWSFYQISAVIQCFTTT